jgi:hypothetical protein
MRVFYGQKTVDQNGPFCYNVCIVNNKEYEMGEFMTGAKVTKIAKLYRVEYKNQVVAEFAIKEVALMFALDGAKLENSLQNSNVFILKAA